MNYEHFFIELHFTILQLQFPKKYENQIPSPNH